MRLMARVGQPCHSAEDAIMTLGPFEDWRGRGPPYCDWAAQFVAALHAASKVAWRFERAVKSTSRTAVASRRRAYDLR
jgi:hypothetical protein